MLLFISVYFLTGVVSVYKLIAVDLDGTLLNRSGSMTDRVRNSINEAKDMGVKIIIVSGRGYKGIKYISESLNLNDFIISLDGAVVTDSKTDRTIFCECLECNMVKKVISICEEMGITSFIFTDKEVYAEKYNAITKIFMDNDKVNVIIEGRLSKFYNSQPAGKLLIIDEHEKLLKLKEKIYNIYHDGINLTFSMPQFLEVYSSKVSKGLMLKKIADYYAIKREEVIAIGDGENDISMIEYAGLGAAMGNAPGTVKERADFITKPISEDGAAYVIEKFILGR